MPIIFIHGVNTRIDEAYHQDRLDRTRQIETLLRPKLPKPFADMAVVEPFWGDDGAHAGSSVLVPKASGGNAEPLGSGAEANEGTAPDLVDVIDTLLLAWMEPVAGHDLPDAQTFESVTNALWGLREDPMLLAHVAGAPDREAIVTAVDEALRKRLAEAEAGARASTSAEAYGGGILKRAGENLKRVFNHPYVKRPVSTTAGSLTRRAAHGRFAMFLGDVLVYLKTRGDISKPGPIVQKVLAELPTDDESVLAITHSMGGNIFYDVVTHFAPGLKVAAWLSVGGQVGFFEYQRLFLASQQGRFSGQKVKKPIVGPWLNVFDPVDPFAFLAKPVFEGVEDFEFTTGSSILSAHGDYFIRENFYVRAGERLGTLLAGEP